MAFYIDISIHGVYIKEVSSFNSIQTALSEVEGAERIKYSKLIGLWKLLSFHPELVVRPAHHLEPAETVEGRNSTAETRLVIQNGGNFVFRPPHRRITRITANYQGEVPG